MCVCVSVSVCVSLCVSLCVSVSLYVSVSVSVCTHGRSIKNAVKSLALGENNGISSQVKFFISLCQIWPDRGSNAKASI